jgi:two-component system, NarL family, sensor kinase
MKKAVLFIFCIQLLLSAFAQHNEHQNDIHNILSSHTADSSKVKILIDSGYKYALAASPVALLYVQEAQKILGKDNSEGTINRQSKLYNTSGIYYMYIGKYDSAIAYYNKSKDLGEKYNNDLIIAKSYNNLGNIAQYKADFQSAINYNLKALEYFEKINDSVGIAGAQGNLANNYLRVNQISKAIEELRKAISIAQKKNEKRLLANLFNTMATAYGEAKNDSFTIYQMKAYQLYKELNNLKGLATTTINLGEIYVDKKQNDSALHYFKEGIQYAMELEDVQNLGTLYSSLAILYHGERKIREANSAVDSAIHYSTLSGDKLSLSKSYKEKSALLYDQNDYKQGYEYFKKYSVLNDSIFNDNMQTSIAEMQTKYETEKKERQIAEQSFRLAKKNYWIAGISLLLIGGVLLSISWTKRVRLRNEKRLQAEIIKHQDIATKAVIEAEEKERKRIAGDLHDGVGQIMSAVKMNLSNFENKTYFKSEDDRLRFEKIIALVDESCKEVRSVSHNMMPNALLKSGLSSAVKEFVDKIDHSVLKVNLYSEGLNQRLDSNIETVLYRVIQECVNNVIKHSGANQLDISLIKDNDGISATIEDNGKGFDPLLIGKADGIGLKNIITRIQYLKGTVDFDTKPGKGTLVAIHVPTTTKVAAI